MACAHGSRVSELLVLQLTNLSSDCTARSAYAQYACLSCSADVPAGKQRPLAFAAALHRAAQDGAAQRLSALRTAALGPSWRALTKALRRIGASAARAYIAISACNAKLGFCGCIHAHASQVLQHLKSLLRTRLRLCTSLQLRCWWLAFELAACRPGRKCLGSTGPCCDPSTWPQPCCSRLPPVFIAPDARQQPGSPAWPTLLQMRCCPLTLQPLALQSRCASLTLIVAHNNCYTPALLSCAILGVGAGCEKWLCQTSPSPPAGNNSATVWQTLQWSGQCS